MSTLKVRLEVAVNLLVGTCVFDKYRAETERVAKILDHRNGWIKEPVLDTEFGRAFKTLELKNRKFFNLRRQIHVLRRRVNNFYRMGVDEISELERWFNELITEHLYENEYSIDCPWVQQPASAVVEENIQGIA